MLQETAKLVDDWLLGRAGNTQEAYRREIGRFLDSADRPPVEINREHLGAYLDDLTALRLKASSISRAVYVIRSFWEYLFDEGHIDRSPFRRIQPAKPRDDLARRILSEAEVMRLLSAFRDDEEQCRGRGFGTRDGEAEILDCLLGLERDGLSMLDCARELNKRDYRTRSGHVWNPSGVCGVLGARHSYHGWENLRRNTLLLRTLYYCGSRIGETVALRWRDLQPRVDTGQFTFFGKGSQTRAVVMPQKLYLQLCEYRDYLLLNDDDPVFRSRKDDSHISARYATRIVKLAAEKAGIRKEVSPHWLRHAHASHSLDHGCPTHVLRDTLGHSSLITTSRYAHVRPDASSSTYLPDVAVA